TASIDLKVDTQNLSFPGNKHILNVLMKKQWTSHSSCHFTLELSDSILTLADQRKSSTMIATKLLNHYFSGLSKYGFRNQGSPSGLISENVQYAGNVWFKDNNNISIFGNVYVNLNDKSALVSMSISEKY
ncbi:hypothetical protein K8I31_11315, partial [bacterium]|nr:hypothetical protein [bacterium]